MSLSTTSAGGLGGAAGGGGVAMAHSAHAIARPAPTQPPPQSGIPLGPGMPPPSLAALGADLLDKNQSISIKQVKNLSKYPIVAMDIYGSDPLVAMFPPKPKDPSQTVSPKIVGKLKSHVALKNTEVAHKTLRKYLTKSKTYSSLRADSLGPDGVMIDHPHQWLGVRRVDQIPEFVQESFQIVHDSSSHAIAEESATSVGVTVSNGTLDGTSAPTGDDFDRVVYKVRLHESKKALAVLPEEALSLVFALARLHVSRKAPKVDKDNEEEALDYPLSVPVPAWACHDAAIEALLDAMGGTGVVFQRSMAALAGSVQPGDEGSPNVIIERVNHITNTKRKEHQKEHPNENAAPFQYEPLLILVGIAADGVECTAVQVSSLQPDCSTCPYGNFKVLANVSYQTKDPVSQVSMCVKEMYTNLEHIAPDEDGPVGFVTYGTVEEQNKTKGILKELRSTLNTWEKVPVFSTRTECVAVGAAVLGAASHGRVRTFVRRPGGKPEAQLAIRIQNVAPTAVGVRMNYHGGAKSKWSPVKVIFDYDRRVPAGPFPVDVKSAEGAAIRNSRTDLSDEALLNAMKEYEGAEGIPEREKAALDLRIQIVQQWQRNGEWINVGDATSPLIKKGRDDEKIACERVAVELSVGPTGMITCGLVGERESVVEATASARNSKLRFYIGILASVLFFGGLLVKSYLGECVFDRDTKRLLAYYKHVVPDSIMDGDEHNARYLVWKYRGKKDKLWKRLESKYGVPVLHVHEWEDYGKDEESGENNEEENLDEKPKEESQDDEGDTPDL